MSVVSEAVAGGKSLLEAFKVRKPWAAALVAFVDPFIGMLYLGRAAIAFLYFGVELAAFLVIMYMLPNGLFGPSPQVVLGIVFLPIRLTGTVHAFVLAQRRTLGMPQQWYARWYFIVLTAFVIPVLGGSLRSYFFEPFHLAGASMAPTLNTSDNVGASKSAYDSTDPKRGDVILLYVPSGKRFVRRIIGMPGDHIQVKDGVLFLNDTAVHGRITYITRNASTTTSILKRYRRAKVITSSISSRPDLVTVLQTMPCRRAITSC